MNSEGSEFVTNITEGDKKITMIPSISNVKKKGIMEKKQIKHQLDLLS